MSLQVDIRRRLKGFELRVAFDTADAPLAILGASGSGKSMTLRCIAGIDTPSEGRIVLNGRVLYDSAKKINLPPRLRRVGYLFQDYALFPNMTVEQNIACGIAGPRARREQEARQLMQRYDVQQLADRYPAQISGGQRQRVAMARMFAARPELVLLDEPFSALDAHLREQMQLDMMELLKGFGGDAIMVTHSRDEAYLMCPQLMVLQGGKALGCGQTRSMFLQPGQVEVARITGCKNITAAHSVGDNMVCAPAWGATWRAAQAPPQGLTHIGVRAHSFYPAEPGETNALPVCITGRVENPFEWNVMFVNKAAPDGGVLWWKHGKGAASQPEYMAVRPEDILLLEGE